MMHRKNFRPGAGLSVRKRFEDKIAVHKKLNVLSRKGSVVFFSLRFP